MPTAAVRMLSAVIQGLSSILVISAVIYWYRDMIESKKSRNVTYNRVLIPVIGILVSNVALVFHAFTDGQTGECSIVLMWATLPLSLVSVAFFLTLMQMHRDIAMEAEKVVISHHVVARFLWIKADSTRRVYFLVSGLHVMLFLIESSEGAHPITYAVTGCVRPGEAFLITAVLGVSLAAAYGLRTTSKSGFGTLPDLAAFVAAADTFLLWMVPSALVIGATGYFSEKWMLLSTTVVRPTATLAFLRSLRRHFVIS